MEDFTRDAVRLLRALYSEIPFIGRLDFADRPSIARAVLETAVTVFASSFPVWIAILVLFLPDPSWTRATHEVVKNGELFLLSAATVGPLLYVVPVVYPAADGRFLTSFPHGIYYLLVTATMIALSAAIIALRSMQSVGSGVDFDISAYSAASWWCYGFAVFIFFTASAHRNRVDHPPTNINKPSEDFSIAGGGIEMTNEELPFEPVADLTPQTITIKAQKVRQPVGDMYIASVDSKIVTRISHFDVRRIQKEAREVETYLGIQRPLNEKRVLEIGNYVNFQDASFPGAIILALDSDYAEFDEQTGEISIRNFRTGEDKPTRAMKDIARVLDGQHRIAGLEHFDKDRVFEVIATVFIGADISDQAYIFATVNLEQRKVNRSLGYDLFALARSRSPERTCHNIAVSFDRDIASPFHRRIKRLGTATPERDFETLTQATFVDGLLQHISRTPKSDRDALLRQRAIAKPSQDEKRRLIFRHFFLTDESDLEIARTFDAYFQAVKARWPDAWDARGYGTMLGRTNGYRALCRFLKPAFLKYSDGTKAVGTPEFTKVLAEIGIRDDEFVIDNFPAGTSGESKLYNRLLEKSGLASLAER